MQAIADEFRALAAATSISTPAIDRLYTHLAPSATPIADGSAELSLSWSGVWALGVGLAAVTALAGLLLQGAL